MQRSLWKSRMADMADHSKMLLIIGLIVACGLIIGMLREAKHRRAQLDQERHNNDNKGN